MTDVYSPISEMHRKQLMGFVSGVSYGQYLLVTKVQCHCVGDKAVDATDGQNGDMAWT